MGPGWEVEGNIRGQGGGAAGTLIYGRDPWTPISGYRSDTIIWAMGKETTALQI